MIQWTWFLSVKVVGSVLAMQCEPSIISIGPLLMKLLYLYVEGWLACWWDEWKWYITKAVVVWSTWSQVQNWSIITHQSILHVQSCTSDHWLPSYGVDLIADFVRATLTLRSALTLAKIQNRATEKVKDIKIKFILIRLKSCKDFDRISLFDLIIDYWIIVSWLMSLFASFR